MAYFRVRICRLHKPVNKFTQLIIIYAHIIISLFIILGSCALCLTLQTIMMKQVNRLLLAHLAIFAEVVLNRAFAGRFQLAAP